MVVASIGRTVNVADLVSHVFELEQAQAVFEDLADRSVWANKTVFAVSDEARAEADAALAASFSAKQVQR